MSVLDRPVRLVELFEPALLEELCQEFVEVHGVGLRIFDAVAGQLTEVGSDMRGLSGLYADPQARRRFVDFVEALKGAQLDVGEARSLTEPISGGRYLLVPIVWDHEVLGKVACGPFLHPDEAGPLGAALPRIFEAELGLHLRLLLKCIDLVCHAGYKALITSTLHLESITRAYEDLQRAHSRLEQSNEQLSTSNARLRDLDQMKSDFLARISHELRTPLTSVMGYAEMVLEELAGPINEEQREYLSTILARSEALLEMIEGVLAFSEAEHGWQSRTAVPVDPQAAVESAVESVRPLARKARLQLEVVLPQGLPPLQAEPGGVSQALVNLLGNAVKFTPAGGVVRVGAVATGRDGAPVVRFSVTDTGIGIGAEDLDRIFEPFYQVDGSSTRAYGGTGLGLSIVKRFVEEHGGRITVESAEGVGSTFSFDLPVPMRSGGST